MQNIRTLALATACVAALCTAGAAHAAQAAQITVDMHLAAANGPGKDIGTIAFEDTDKGLSIRPRLMHLHEGLHGFHVNENASCAAGTKNGEAVPALAAGGPLGPVTTVKKDGKATQARKGDLPGLYVHYDGMAYTPTVAPHLKTADLKGHAIIIEALGPAYDDAPKPVGGAIKRVACGVVMR